MNIQQFFRIGDQSFSFQVQSPIYDKIDVLIYSNLKGKVQISYELIHRIANYFADHHDLLNHETVYFKFGDHLYTLTTATHYTKSICAFVASFFKNTSNPQLKEYELSSVNFFKSCLLQKPIYDLDSLLITRSPLSMPKYFPHSFSPVEQETFFFATLTSKAFSDPYTKLSTLAFQKYEQYYDSHDPKNGENFDSRYMLIETSSDEIKLVNKEKHKSDEKVELTIRNYRLFLVNMYGEAKIKYIEKCYGIDLEKMAKKKKPLTPEIVYRFNIGIGNLEIQDIQALYNKLRLLKNTLEQLPNDAKKNCAFNFLREGRKVLEFSLFEMRGLYRALLQTHSYPSLGVLEHWLNQLSFSLPLDQLNQTQFNTLIQLLSVSHEERESQYTGRKIHYPIQSAYTTAGLELFKPWIDQQELLQIFPNLQGQNWDNYYEKLCHIVCKKHLARQHPTEIYRVGALIPAPKTSKGQAQWYQVTSFVNNGRGIVSYTLEPACPQFYLPVIKLYRSTSSSPYSMDGTPSMRNDVNPLNPPGYQGSYLSEKYEAVFFNNRTIPVWVAYQNQADLQIQQLLNNSELINQNNLLEIFHFLMRATQELQKSRNQQEIYLNLPAFIKKYDAEFIEILSQASCSSNISSSDFDLFLEIILEKEQEMQNLSPVYLRKQRRNARFIIQILQALPNLQPSLLIANLLKKEIIVPFRKLIGSGVEGIELKECDTGNDISEEQPLSLIKLIHGEYRLRMLLGHCGDPLEIFNLLQNWNETLLNHAKSLKENVHSKQCQDLVFGGHSLGGSCAQRGLIQYLTDKRRIPLPEHTITIRLFDDPGIRFDDNEAFKNFGNDHVDLIEKQNSRFRLVRRQEAGDFIVTGGEVHLGATFSPEEEKKVSRWLQFDASVQTATPQAIDFSIAYSTTAHATQFETGKRHSPWIAEIAEQYLQNNHRHHFQFHKIKKIQHFLGDYTRTWYTTSVQGMFNLGPKSKHWEHIKDIWNIPFVDSKSGEKIRLQAGLTLYTRTSVLELLKTCYTVPEKDDDLHGEWWRYRDSNGVFAINEKGIVTSTLQST